MQICNSVPDDPRSDDVVWKYSSDQFLTRSYLVIFDTLFDEILRRGGMYSLRISMEGLLPLQMSRHVFCRNFKMFRRTSEVASAILKSTLFSKRVTSTSFPRKMVNRQKICQKLFACIHFVKRNISEHWWCDAAYQLVQLLYKCDLWRLFSVTERVKSDLLQHRNVRLLCHCSAMKEILFRN